MTVSYLWFWKAT